MQVNRIPKNEPYFMAAVCICFVGHHADVLLLQKRKDHPIYPNLWGFPAGKLQPNERTFVQAALREIKEETGNTVPINRLRVLDTRAYLHHKPDGESFYFIARSYVADLPLPSYCRNTKEHKSALIVPAEDIIEMNPRNFIPDTHEAFVRHFQLIIKESKLYAPHP